MWAAHACARLAPAYMRESTLHAWLAHEPRDDSVSLQVASASWKELRAGLAAHASVCRAPATTCSEALRADRAANRGRLCSPAPRRGSAARHAGDARTCPPRPRPRHRVRGCSALLGYAGGPAVATSHRNACSARPRPCRGRGTGMCIPALCSSERECQPPPPPPGNGRHIMCGPAVRAEPHTRWLTPAAIIIIIIIIIIMKGRS